MKIRLTESQYDKLLKLVNPSKKIIITESQYKRLILEGNSQVEFNKIKDGQAFKIKTSSREFEFEVIGSDNGQLLVKNTNDGRYTNVYFFIDFNAIDNKQLITKISKSNAGPYSKITPELIKDTETWKVFTFKNLNSFKVFKDKTFSDELFSIDVNTGEEVEQDNEGDLDVNLQVELRDNLIKGIVPNNSYKITFYDKSTLKFFVTDKKGSIITIKFKTKSGKDKMDYLKVGDAEMERRDSWFNQQNKLIDSLKLELTRTTDPNKKKTLQDKIDDATNLLNDYFSKSSRSEGFETISVSDYTDGIASKWVEKIEESTEYKFGKSLTIDLSKIKVREGKAKVISPEEDKKKSDLNQKLSNATDDTEREKIKNELTNLDRELTLHFLNQEFDVVNNTNNSVTFDLIVQLNYVPEEVNKQTKNGMEWTRNIDSKTYFKNFPLYGIESLMVINDDKGPSLTDKREVKKGDRFDLNDISIEYSKIKNYIKNDINAQNMILKRPNIIMQLLGFKDKGIIPLEKLQSDLGFYTSRKDPNDKFIASHYILFNCDFDNEVQIFNQEQFDMFKKLLNNGIQTKGLVKRYAIGDEHVALNMKDVENDILYTMLILDKKESEQTGVDSKGAQNEYDVLLKFNRGKNKKEKVANFKIKVLDYNAAKTN